MPFSSTPSETIFTSEESTVDETGLEVEIPAETVENIDSTGETKETKPAPTATSTPTPMPTATPAPTPTPKPATPTPTPNQRLVSRFMLLVSSTLDLVLVQNTQQLRLLRKVQLST